MATALEREIKDHLRQKYIEELINRIEKQKKERDTMKNRVRLRHAIRALATTCWQPLEAWKAGNMKAMKPFTSRKTYKFLCALPADTKAVLVESVENRRKETLLRALETFTDEQIASFIAEARRWEAEGHA